jgi:hypothetical protein
MRVELNLIFEVFIFEILKITMQSNELRSQDVRSCFYIAWNLNFVTVTIVRSNLICPFVYTGQLILAQEVGVFLDLPTEASNPFSNILKNFTF